MDEMIVTTYEPDNCLKKGYPFIFKEIFDEIWKSRWLTYQLFKRELFSLYKQSFIGIFWTILLPIISVAIFMILSRSNIFNMGDTSVPYPVYAILGIAFWQLFSTGLVASSNSLVNAGPMILKINFSKKSLVIASSGKSIVSFLFQFILVGILFLFYGIIPSIAVLLIPILILPILLLTLGLGFIVSLLNGIMRDIGNMISILLTFLMFLTPVLYVKPNKGLLAHMTGYNPLHFLVSAPREFVLWGRMSEWEGFLISSLLSVIVFIVCLVAFHMTETRVAERI